eukprot:TRINITY_DN36057_c0_g1_i1.p1 TRINITY_DN36057_c0_g1~~TRINITY_DN36057_c0_g1_i1.p1  ORF type:complete len:451 (-),score=126.26 TRINITY_DN36057_c0_g1_i1:284-1636(-)
MAKTKASRKGKKEWRKNISIKDYEDHLQQENKEARAGGSLEAVPDSAIFFVDKAGDARIQRKVDRHRKKTLHCDSVIKRGSMAAPVAWAVRSRTSSLPGNLAALPPAAKAAALLSERAKLPEQIKADHKRKAEVDPWAASVGASAEQLQVKEAKAKKARQQPRAEISQQERRHPAAPAVEVDAPGCSFNPTFADHQDALGEAVAQEMWQHYERELRPVAPLIHMPPDAERPAVLDEEDLYFLDVADAERDAEVGTAEDEEDSEAGEPGVSRPVLQKRLTQADLNRRLRRRAAQEELRIKMERKKQRVDLDKLKDIQGEVEEEQEETDLKRARLKADREEKHAKEPPRLGKHRFKPEPVQVLLSDEVTGSLRTLKGCHTLAKDRFKSLQRRGILEPRIPVIHKKAKNRRVVEQGTRGWKEREMHAEMLARRAEAKGRTAKGKGLDDIEVFE